MFAPTRLACKRILNQFCRAQSRKANPGLNYQISAIEEVVSDIEKNPEGFGDLESDLLNVHKSYKNYEIEQQQRKDQIRKYVVKSKYFKDAKLPNFLTYAEKENIRHLHNKDPEQWSVEVLSESFPANSEIIKKILKADWKPRSIQSHDAAVYRNWERFNKGELEIPKELDSHLRKFSHRRLETPSESNSVALAKTEESSPISTEFSSLISGKKSRPKTVPAKNVKKQSVKDMQEETFLLDRVVNRNYMRVSDIKDLQGIQTSQGSETNPAVATTKNEAETTSEKNFLDALSMTHKFTSNEVEISENDKQLFEMSKVKSRIHIPRKIYRKGATYRVDDTYYDDDGEFLYRVPGMTGQ
ncbi:uncharacterized protein [Musca autumnalis]|uniref:uncharacterized protein n=1 Tax=Musca autumnalis TaxID=221902 RepID=UPI003CEBFFEE